MEEGFLSRSGPLPDQNRDFFGRRTKISSAVCKKAIEQTTGLIQNLACRRDMVVEELCQSVVGAPKIVTARSDEVTETLTGSNETLAGCRSALFDGLDQMVAGCQKVALLLVEAANQGFPHFGGACVEGADEIIARRSEMEPMGIEGMFEGGLRRGQHVACRIGALRDEGCEALTGIEQFRLALGDGHARRLDRSRQCFAGDSRPAVDSQ